MEFIDYNKIKLFSLNLGQPTFISEKGIYLSSIYNENNNKVGIKKINFRLLQVKNRELHLEFLYSTNEFYNFMLDLDKYIRDQIISNGSTWFGNNLDGDTINNIYKTAINLPDKIPSFPYIKFLCHEDCKITGKKRKKCQLDDLKPNMELEIDFLINGVFYYPNKCNISYSVTQIKVVNDICQSFNSLFHEDNEPNNEPNNERNNEDKLNNNIESETHDITASTFKTANT